MKKILLCFLSATSLLVHAQKTKDSIDYKTAITFNPSMLLSIDYCFMAGAEYRINPKMVVALEAGYIFASDKIGNWQNNQNQNQSQNQNGSGFIIRPAIKFFVNEKNTFYLQPQMFYKQVTHHLYDWLGKDVVNGVASYEQLQNFDYRRKITGVNAVAGVLVPLGKKTNTFIDFYFGIGFRNKSAFVVGEPRSVYQERERIVLTGDNGIFTSLPAGLRLVVGIN